MTLLNLIRIDEFDEKWLNLMKIYDIANEIKNKKLNVNAQTNITIQRIILQILMVVNN